MKLSVEYLNDRHSFWKEKIGAAGIWDAGKFGEITIVVRPASKSYNGLFIRRYLKIKGKRELVDRIFIYNQSEEFEPRYLDSILVHEMIHQYIIQNKIKDTSSHGRLFRHYMKRINEEFGGELKINIRDKNPNQTLQQEIKMHVLLIMHLDSGYSFCSVINPKKTAFFENMVRKNRRLWKIKEYYWATSYSTCFNSYSKCTRSLHGIKKPRKELEEFCRLQKVARIEAK